MLMDLVDEIWDNAPCLTAITVMVATYSVCLGGILYSCKQPWQELEHLNKPAIIQQVEHKKLTFEEYKRVQEPFSKKFPEIN